jgi:hypothetical protein
LADVAEDYVGLDLEVPVETARMGGGVVEVRGEADEGGLDDACEVGAAFPEVGEELMPDLISQYMQIHGGGLRSV